MKRKYTDTIVFVTFFLLVSSRLIGQYQIVPAYNTQQVNNIKDYFKIFLLNTGNQSQEVIITADLIGKDNITIATYKTMKLRAPLGQMMISESKFKLDQLFEPSMLDKTGSNVKNVNYNVLSADELNILYNYSAAVNAYSNTILTTSISNNCSALLSWSPSVNGKMLNYELVITDCNIDAQNPLFERNTSTTLTKGVIGTSYQVYPDNKTIIEGRKYCWEILYIDENKNIIDRSELKEFEINCGKLNNEDSLLQQSHLKMSERIDDSYYLKEVNNKHVNGFFTNRDYPKKSLKYRIKSLNNFNEDFESEIKVVPGDNFLNFIIPGNFNKQNEYYLIELFCDNKILNLKYFVK